MSTSSRRDTRKYIAFISYRHKDYDMAVAKRIHKIIESYRIPKQLRKSGEKRLGLAFRDQEELPVSGNLSSDICEALDNSEFLVVICTPDTPKSHWVTKEIEFFLQRHDHSHVLAVLASGTPEQSFPHVLTHIGDEIVEPLAANMCASSMRKEMKLLKKEYLRLIAAILHCSYDTLVKREQHRRKRQIALSCGLALTILLGYIGILINSNIAINEKNNELIAANTLLAEQKHISQINESRFLTLAAQRALQNNDKCMAIQNSINALPHNESDRPYYALAESVLDTALLIFQPGKSENYIASNLIESNQEIKTLSTTENGDYIVMIDTFDNISVYNPYTGELKWKTALSSRTSKRDYTYSKGEARFYLNEKNNQIIVLYRNEILVFSINSGDLIWKTGKEMVFEQISLSPNAETLVCFSKQSQNEHDLYALLQYNTSNWNESKSVYFQDNLSDVSAFTKIWDDITIGNTGFSDDEKYFFGTLYGVVGGMDYLECYYLLDIEKNELNIIYSNQCSRDHYYVPPIIWMGFNNAEKDHRCILTVIKEVSEQGQELIINVIDVNNGTLIKEDIVSPENNIVRIEWEVKHCILHWKRDLLLVSAGHQLYLIRVSSGEVLEKTNMPDTIIGLFAEEGNFFFGFVLSNGMYAIGNWSNERGFLTSDEYIGSYNLGEANKAYAGKNGFIKSTGKDNSLDGMYAGDYESGFGYIAVIPQDNPRNIQIKHLAFFNSPELQEDKISDKTFLYKLIDSLPLRINADGSILLNENGVWKCIDREKKVVSQEYSNTSLYYFDSIWPIFGTSDYIINTSDGGVKIYKASTHSEELLADGKRYFIKHLNDQIDLAPYLTKSSSVWLTESDEVLTVQCDGEKLLIWKNGTIYQSVAVPDSIKWFLQEDDKLSSMLVLGSNGLIVLSNYTMRKVNSTYNIAIYSAFDNVWIIPDEEVSYISDSIITLGTISDCIAFCDKDGMIHIINDIHNLKDEIVIETDCSLNAIKDLRFVVEDKFLVLYSDGTWVNIYSTSEGKCVYEGYLGEAWHSLTNSKITAELDERNNRVYIIDSNIHLGLCLDYESWIELGRINNVYAYDPTNNELYYFNNNGIFARHMPSLQEIIDIGLAILE